MMISLRRKTAWNTKPSPSCSGTRAAHKQCRSVYIAFYCGCCPLICLASQQCTVLGCSTRAKYFNWRAQKPNSHRRNFWARATTRWEYTSHTIGGNQGTHRQDPASFCSLHADLPDFSGKLTNLTILSCKLCSQERTWLEKQSEVINRISIQLELYLVLPLTLPILSRRSVLWSFSARSVKLTFPAEGLEACTA